MHSFNPLDIAKSIKPSAPAPQRSSKSKISSPTARLGQVGKSNKVLHCSRFGLSENRKDDEIRLPSLFSRSIESVIFANRLGFPMMLILFLYIVICTGAIGLCPMHQCHQDSKNLESVVELIVEEISRREKCIVFVTDSTYRSLAAVQSVSRSSDLLRYQVALRDNEQFRPPKKHVETILRDSKIAGCNAYVILIANGILVSEFLQYAERERLINTRGSFLLLHDQRLFLPTSRYLWNRIVNVVFIRRYNAYKRRSGDAPRDEHITLNTVYYPPHKTSFVPMKYLDSWYRGRLRYGNNHFMEKTANFRGKSLRIAIFEHLPAVTEKSRAYYSGRASNTEALGIEFEVIARAMKFKPKYYMPYDIESQRWGTKQGNETYTGLIGEAIKGKAAFYLGDLHYTLHHLDYFDLTIPYNTECLTFLTPESLRESSWKLLILPFKLYTWIALLLTLVLGGIVFYFLSFSYKKHVSFYKNKITGDDLRKDHGIKNLYLFTEVQNSILYSYSMLVQVSLPGLPNLMAVRILIGWWWVYSILVAVAYRASMTATLANPVARVTIDTLAQLAKSSIDVGGWNDDSKEFFLMSSDTNSQEIGNKFQLVENEKEAIERVANGSFCYYDNKDLLRDARVRRQVLEKQMQSNATDEKVKAKYNLHIMGECAVNMPVAIGMEKNSPLKPHVDIWIRRLTETGLVEKWLSDVMEWSKITEIREEAESEKALVNFHKLQGAFIGVAVGYALGLVVLIGEILYWRFVVLRDPAFDKYHLDLYYGNVKPITG